MLQAGGRGRASSLPPSETLSVLMGGMASPGVSACVAWGQNYLVTLFPTPAPPTYAREAVRLFPAARIATLNKTGILQEAMVGGCWWTICLRFPS